jgi:protein SCO1/2
MSSSPNPANTPNAAEPTVAANVPGESPADEPAGLPPPPPWLVPTLGFTASVLAVIMGVVVYLRSADMAERRKRAALLEADNVSGRSGVEAPTPKDFGSVGPWKLTERSGSAKSDADLKGRLSVWGFVYTTCPGMCRSVTARMASLRKSLPAEVQMVSLSVDPATDTPAALKAYAELHRAPPDSWWFLTGDPAAVRDLVTRRFRLPAEPNPNPGPGEEPIAHSPQLALVDGDGKILGYFSSQDNFEIDRLLEKIAKLTGSPVAKPR